MAEQIKLYIFMIAIQGLHCEISFETIVTIVNVIFHAALRTKRDHHCNLNISCNLLSNIG